MREAEGGKERFFGSIFDLSPVLHWLCIGFIEGRVRVLERELVRVRGENVRES